MKTLLSVALPCALMLSLQAGCGSDAPAPSPDVAGDTRADALVASIDASTNSRLTAGIVKWHFYRTAAGTHYADGVDASGKQVVKVTVRNETQKTDIGGVDGERVVRTIESSNGGLVRVTEHGELLERRADELGITLFAQDLSAARPEGGELALYDCNHWWDQMICTGWCAACGVGAGYCGACGGCIESCSS